MDVERLKKQIQEAFDKDQTKLEENFEANGKTYLVSCPKCKRENYAMSVSSGICAWCGYNANKEKNEG